MSETEQDAFCLPVVSHFSHRISLATFAETKMKLTIVLQIFDLNHKEKVSPFMIVDNGDVALSKYTTNLFLKLSSCVSRFRMIRVPMLVHYVQNILLCALIQTEILILQI